MHGIQQGLSPIKVEYLAKFGTKSHSQSIYCSTNSKSHEVAAQLKLLADAPEKIWQCLEDQSYLLAAQYFLLSRHIFSHLELSGAGSDVVKKLWHSVSSFKDTIMEVCESIIIVV